MYAYEIAFYRSKDDCDSIGDLLNFSRRLSSFWLWGPLVILDLVSISIMLFLDVTSVTRKP